MNTLLVIVCGIIGILALLYQWRQNRVLRHRVDYWKFAADHMSEWVCRIAGEKRMYEDACARHAINLLDSTIQAKRDGEVQAEMLADLLEMSKERDEAVKDALADRLNYEGAMMRLAQLQEKMEKGKKRSHKKGGK